jgi:hypothetical protein
MTLARAVGAFGWKGDAGAASQRPAPRHRAGKGSADRGLGPDHPAVGERVAAGPERRADALGCVRGPFGDRRDRPRTGQDRSGGDEQDGDQRVTTPGARPEVVDRGKVGEQVPGLGWLELIGVGAGSGRLGSRLMSQQARASTAVIRLREPHDPGRSCLLHIFSPYHANRTCRQNAGALAQDRRRRGPGSRRRPRTRRDRSLGPRWVRAATVHYGHRRSPAVANGSEESQVVGPAAQAAGRMQAGDSDCGSEGRGCWIAVTPGPDPDGLAGKHLGMGRGRAQ